MKYSAVGVLQADKTVQGARKQVKWLLIQYDGGTGYVFSDYLVKYTLRYSAVENLCLRTGPGTGYPIVGLLKKGDSVLAGNRAGKWRQISYCGQNSCRAMRISPGP